LWLPALQYRVQPEPTTVANQPALRRLGQWLSQTLPGISRYNLPLSLPADNGGKTVQVQLLTYRDLIWKYPN
jgi:hypothetical protein